MDPGLRRDAEFFYVLLTIGEYSMTHHIRIFAGPSLHGCARDGAAFAPPAQCGDFIRAVRQGITHIMLIDGYFESRVAVWHKEILWAMEQGVIVAGAASMGALRAAELHSFGMIGVGKIFANYRDDSLTGDDEVAVSHGPAELGYLPTNIALVNVRATVAAAVQAQRCDQAMADKVLQAAQAVFFKQRSWQAVVAKACLMGDDVLLWLQAHYVDQKKRDALEALEFAGHEGFLAATPLPISVPRTCFLNGLLARV
jgi:hypothetical protein